MQKKDDASLLTFYVNGVRFEYTETTLRTLSPTLTLNYFLRRHCGLTGTKLGCEEGGCGACCVVLSTYDKQTQQPKYLAVNSCLTPLYLIDGYHIITIEGIGSHKKLHPIQERLAETHASQCGFCTPGFTMTLYAALRSKPKPGSTKTMRELEEALQGNLCRCTGYRPILDAAKTFADDFQCCKGVGASSSCSCKLQLEEQQQQQREASPKIISSSTYDKYKESFQPLNEGEEFIFPPSLKHHITTQLTTHYHDEAQSLTRTWYRPLQLSELLQEITKHPSYIMIYGTSDFIKGNRKASIFIDTTHIDELKSITIDSLAMNFGASVTLSDLLNFLSDQIDQAGGEDDDNHWKYRSVIAFRDQLKKYATPLIRNFSGIGGNIYTTDLTPILLTLNAFVIEARWENGEIMKRSLSFEEYLSSPRDYTRLIISFQLPFLQSPNEYIMPAKLAITKDRSTAASFFVRLSTHHQNTSYPHPSSDLPLSFINDHHHSLDDLEFPFEEEEDDDDSRGEEREGVKEGWKVEEIRIAFSRFYPQAVIRCHSAETYLRGNDWSKSSLYHAMKFLSYDLLRHSIYPHTDLHLIPSSHLPSILERSHHRRITAASFLFQFFLHVQTSLSSKPTNQIQHADKNNQRFTTGLQSYPEPPEAPVGSPHLHSTAYQQVSGEAVYVDDIPSPEGCLYAGLVVSEHARAKIISVEIEDALKVKGVVRYFDKTDVVISDIENDREKIFVLQDVRCKGEVIGIIVATSQSTANYAASLVKVNYEVYPPIITIADAIRSNSFYPYTHSITDGDVDSIFSNLNHSNNSNNNNHHGDDDDVEGDGKYGLVEGEVEIGGQEHFYMEPHAIMAVPGDANEMIIHSCTQCVYKTQKIVSQALGLPNHKIAVKVKRIGGGFGGKETFSMYLAARCAIAAYNLHKPVRILVDRDVDMQLSGGRHPFYAKYKAAYVKQRGNEEGEERRGKIVALDVTLYNNGGCTGSTTGETMDRALCHIHNAYRIPNVRVRGYLCKTNTSSNTAFRGFGAPQGMFVSETIIDHIARSLSLPITSLREMNLLTEGDYSPFGQIYNENHLSTLWRSLSDLTDLQKRQSDLQTYNLDPTNQYHPRGIAVIPTVYGICFPVKYLNQSGALVMIYPDGSVLISHGGTEMGQGLNIKLIQIAAKLFNIPTSQIHISETASDKVPNTSPTAASVGADINGGAVVDACQKLIERLAPLRAANPEISFSQLATLAYFQRISLFAEGFYRTPNCSDYDWNSKEEDNKKKGAMYHYFAYGISCSEVEVNVLTGEFDVIRSDVIMDVGKSLNSAIDIGQVEGAFIQGMGYFTYEEVLIDPTSGEIQSKGPGSYKIPHSYHVPKDFRVHLLPNSNTSPAVFSSKAVGEPPLFLSCSVFFAIKEAIYSFRAKHGDHSYFALNSPATADKIRKATNDVISKFVTQFDNKLIANNNNNDDNNNNK